MKKVGNTFPLRSMPFLGLSFSVALLVSGGSSAAEEGRKASAPQTQLSVFSRDEISRSFFTEEAPPAAVAPEVTKSDPVELAPPAATLASSEVGTNTSSEPTTLKLPVAGPEYVSNDPAAHITPPDEDAKVRINPEAPGPFKAMAAAFQDGDMPTAKLFARQFVRYMVNLMFQVKQMTSLIGEAMIQEGIIKDEDWIGVEQYLDYEMAQARSATGSAIKPTHEEALKLIKPDPKGEVEVYYFFTLKSSWSRKMAPDVERLWQVAKSDKRVKFVALTMGPYPKDWIEPYREFTGLTAPIQNGEEVAKAFKIAFTPAVVIVTKNSGKAYLKTGQQDFKRLYEFLKTAQGESPAMTLAAQKIAQSKIGLVEKNVVSEAGTPAGYLELDFREPAQKSVTKREEEIRVQRF